MTPIKTQSTEQVEIQTLAKQLAKDTEIKVVDLSNKRISDESANYVSAMIRSNNIIEQLVLANCQLSNYAISEILGAIAERGVAGSLHVINLTGNSPEGLGLIQQFSKKYPCLQLLYDKASEQRKINTYAKL